MHSNIDVPQSETEKLPADEDLEANKSVSLMSEMDTTTKARMAALAIICCCLLFVVSGIVVGVVVFGGKDDKNKGPSFQSIDTAVPTMNPVVAPTDPPVTSPPVDGPTESPTKSPSAPPTMSPAPSETIPEEVIIRADSDTYITDGFDGNLPHGDEDIFLIENAIDRTSFALLTFNTSEIPPPENIFERQKSVILKLTHEPSTVVDGPPSTLTVIDLGETTSTIEELTNETFSLPMNLSSGIDFQVNPTETTIDVDISTMIFSESESSMVRTRQRRQLDDHDDGGEINVRRSQLFIAIVNLGNVSEAGNGSNLFKSSEAGTTGIGGGGPELLIGLTRPTPTPTASMSPSISSVPTVAPTSSVAPTRSPKPSLRPSTPPSPAPSLVPTKAVSLSPTSSSSPTLSAMPSIEPTHSSSPTVSVIPTLMESSNPSTGTPSTLLLSSSNEPSNVQESDPPVDNTNQPPTGPFPICNVCGDGNVISLPNGSITVPGRNPASCQHYQDIGDEGNLPPPLCTQVQAGSEGPCGCEPTV